MIPSVRLQIHQTYAQLGIQAHPGKLSIQQLPAHFEMGQTPPKVDIHTELGQVRIDQSQCFAEAGLKSVFALTAEAADHGRQQALETVARIAQDGNALMAIENGSNAIAQLAEQNGWTPEGELNMVTMPQSRPKIDFVGGTVTIEPHMGKVEIDTYPNKPRINYQPSKVEIYLRQRASISFEPQVDYRM